MSRTPTIPGFLPRRTLTGALALLATTVGVRGQSTFRTAPPAETHITWTHNNAHSPKRYLPETLPPGVAIFDYDNDGWMDILFVNTGTATFFKPATKLHHALYHNNHDGTFTDVTEKAGINADLFGMGIAVGDYDGDGFPDIFISGYEKSVLYHNTGKGTFEEVTDKSQLHVPGWSTSALWFDYNGDGKLDLFVCQFVDYSTRRVCGSSEAYAGLSGSQKAADPNQTYYCIPRILPPTPSHLYRNNGDGTFTDVSRETGLLAVKGKGLGVVATDVNNDGWLDLFEANDTVPNFLFVNVEGKAFAEQGLFAAVAYSEDGLPRSGMGVDAADFDQDGRNDLFVANVDNEMFSIYHNEGDGNFADFAAPTGIAEATRLLSGWGLKFFDFDNDGNMDLILANGHPDDLIERRMTAVTTAEPLLLFHNEGEGKFKNVSAAGGEAFRGRFSARGLAVGDLNNDGFLDVLVAINGAAPLVLMNNVPVKNHWVGLRLRGVVSNRDAIGAVIRWSVGGKVFSRLKTSGGSYLSSHDPREVIGIGAAEKIDWIEVHWPRPSSAVDRLENVPLDKYSTVVEGRGIEP